MYDDSIADWRRRFIWECIRSGAYLEIVALWKCRENSGTVDDIVPRGKEIRNGDDFAAERTLRGTIEPRRSIAEG